MNITTLSLRPALDRVLRRSPAVLFFLLFPFLAVSTHRSLSGQTEENEFVRSRLEMVDKDLRARGIKDQRVLEAMSTVPRHLFVAEKDRPSAYGHRPLPIGAGQTISQPYIVALMTELLELRGGERVLEIGTGSGYQAAVLSHIAKEVYSIEIVPALAERAKATLARLGYSNVWVRTGDGFYGWEEKQPFDAILLTAAAEKIPEPLWRQLREEGRVVLPLGEARQRQKLVRVRKMTGRQQVENITGVIFVPMTGEIRKGAR